MIPLIIIFICLTFILCKNQVLTITEYHGMYKNKNKFFYGGQCIHIIKMEITDEVGKVEAFIKFSNGHIICITE